MKAQAILTKSKSLAICLGVADFGIYTLSMLRFSVVLFAVMFAAKACFGIIGATPVASSDARFDAVGAFTLDEWRNLNVPIGNAVLIAPDRVVLPRHVINGNYRTRTSVDGTAGAYVVRFTSNPDGTRGSMSNPASFFHVKVTRWIVPNGRSTSDDIVIGVLAQPVTHITPMAINWRPSMPRGGLAANLLSWGPDEAGIKGALRIGGIRISSISNSSFSFRLGAYGVRNDSGAAAVTYNAQGQPTLVGFLTTSRSGIALRRWQASSLFR